jgi:putative DNA primase/helicase
LAETDNPATWVNFETAVRTYLDYGCDGIGICRTADLIFGELDGVIDAEGHIRSFPWAQKFLTAVRGRAYVESSPSGAGIHAICRGILPPGHRQFDEPGQIHTGFALYDSSRYFTITGHILKESGSIQDITQVLASLHKELFPTQKPNGTAHLRGSSQPTASLTDAELLAKARRAANGSAFARLFDDGDWQDIYPSQSEADLALCNHLAFWTGCDPAQMDRLFRQSGLFDSKWEERADYRQRTIEMACSGVNSTYDPEYEHKPQEATVNGSESNVPPRSASSAAAAATESPSPPLSSPPPPPPSEPDLEQPEVSPSRRRRLICVRPPYRSLVPQALLALHDLNQDSPKIFLQRGLPLQVVSDETGRYFIRPITPEALVGYLDQAADFASGAKTIWWPSFHRRRWPPRSNPCRQPIWAS